MCSVKRWITLKSNGNKALNDDISYKVTSIKRLTLSNKIKAMKRLTLLKNWSHETFNDSSLHRFIAVNTIQISAEIHIKEHSTILLFVYCSTAAPLQTSPRYSTISGGTPSRHWQSVCGLGGGGNRTRECCFTVCTVSFIIIEPSCANNNFTEEFETS